jgi:type III secretory pathway component EscU
MIWNILFDQMAEETGVIFKLVMICCIHVHTFIASYLLLTFSLTYCSVDCSLVVLGKIEVDASAWD